jgi:hypothetical protein
MPSSTGHCKTRAAPRDYFERLRAPDHPLTDAEKRIALAEIERRYAWHEAQRRDANPSRILTITRVRELERVFADTYGSCLPDDDSGWDDLVIMANHLAHFGGSPERIVARIVEWASTCAPTFPTDKVTARAKLIAANPCKWTADKLAWRLGLTMERRTMLKIKTIGAIDVKREDRPAWLAAHHRQRKGAERRAAGVKPRDLANTDSARRPWEALGMSRATWYRKGKPETGPAHETPRETGTADYIENLYPAVAVSPSARLVQRAAAIESAATLDPQCPGGVGLGEEVTLSSSLALGPALALPSGELTLEDDHHPDRTPSGWEPPVGPASLILNLPHLVRHDGFGRIPLDQPWTMPMRAFAAARRPFMRVAA